MIDHLSFTQFFVKLEPEKFQAWTGFQPMTPAIAVQYSTNWAIKPAGTELATLVRKDHIIIAITAMIDHVFRTFSAVKTYELSYIHLQ